jgi:hypothetical protein
MHFFTNQVKLVAHTPIMTVIYGPKEVLLTEYTLRTYLKKNPRKSDLVQKETERGADISKSDFIVTA